MTGKVPGGFGELGALIRVLDVQAYRNLLLADLQSECRLSHLPRPQQDYGWRVAKQVIQAAARRRDSIIYAIPRYPAKQALLA